MTAAALGATLEVETLDGMQNVNVKPGTQSGQTVIIRNFGMPRLRGSGRGDLIIHLEVQTPTDLTKEQEDLLNQLAKVRGEEKPASAFSEQSTGLFGKLKDAFSGR
jgi:molecular chaperone DnaJ